MKVEPAPSVELTGRAPFAARVLDGTADVLGAVAEAERQGVSGAFQTADWLSALFADVLPVHHAKPLAVEVRAADGRLALVLPLAAVRENGLDVLCAPAFGVSDYGGPILGPAAPADGAAAEHLWRQVRAVLRAHDLIVVENMPLAIAGRINPLAAVRAARPAVHHRHALRVEGTVEELLRGLGKKYRKEVERCGRLLAERGEPVFQRADTAEALAHAYAILEDQQAARRREAGGGYLLQEPAYSRVYARVLERGLATDRAHLFTLGAGGEVGACLMGVTHGRTFTLLRIATAGEAWKRVSPGRLVVIAAMRHFLARGIDTFDMGIGDYAFKQGFGIRSEPLVTLEAALSTRAVPRLAGRRAWMALRGIEPLRRAVHRIRGQGAS